MLSIFQIHVHQVRNNTFTSTYISLIIASVTVRSPEFVCSDFDGHNYRFFVNRLKNYEITDQLYHNISANVNNRVISGKREHSYVYPYILYRKMFWQCTVISVLQKLLHLSLSSGQQISNLLCFPNCK